MIDLPDDSYKATLTRMQNSGMDMSIETLFEFYIVALSKESLDLIKLQVDQTGIDFVEDTEIEFDEGELEEGEELNEENAEFGPSWTLNIYAKLVPDYDSLRKIQKRLNKISNPLGGEVEGWGVSQE